MNKLKYILYTVFGLFVFAPALLNPSLASADTFKKAQENANNFATRQANIATTATDPQVIIANFIKAILAFLGIVFLILVLVGGFLWMTAAGDEKQVDKAKNIIQRAIIGLVVIVLAYALTTFVFNIILKGAQVT